MGNFLHEYTLVRVFFSTMDVSAWVHYGTWTFGHRGTHVKISVLKCLPILLAQYQKVHVLFMYMSRNVQGAKINLQNDFVAKYSCVEKSP